MSPICFSVDLVEGPAFGERAPRFGELALEPPALLDEVDDARRQLGGARPQRRRCLAQHALFFGEISLGRGAGQRLDPAHPRGDRRLADDLEQADVAGAADMRAAAQLDREGPLVVTRAAHRDDPHLIAIFLAEQRQRPFGDRAVRASAERVRTALLARMRSLTSASIARISSCVSGRGWLKSKRSRSGATSEPFCVTCSPRR